MDSVDYVAFCQEQEGNEFWDEQAEHLAWIEQMEIRGNE